MADPTADSKIDAGENNSEGEIDLEAARLAQEQQQYETRVRHFKKRMNRATIEYNDLKLKIEDMKARFNSPLPDPKICPSTLPVLPQPLKRRKRPQPGYDDDEDEGGGGDARKMY